MDSSRPRIVDWFRTDASRRMRRALVIGPLLLTTGGLVIAISFLTRQPASVRVESAFAGFVLIAGAAAFTLASMQGILRDEISVVVRTDAVVVQSARGDIVVPWGDLREARWDAAEGALILERIAGAGEAVVVRRSFARATGADVAGRVQQQKRRADLGLPA
jgi:hypothetical protein